MDRAQNADDSPVARSRLWAAMCPHAVDPGALGEYAVKLHRDGAVAAQRMFPSVVAHLARRCETCEGDLKDFVALVEAGQGGKRGGGRSPEIAAQRAYFHSVDITQTVDALLNASDTLARLGSDLVRAHEQVRRLRRETEEQLQNLTVRLTRKPDRIQQGEEETGKHVRAMENLIAQLMSEVDAILASYERLSGEGERGSRRSNDPL